jgi:signal transduction histidine kinase
MKVEYPLNRRPAAADIRVVESMLPLMALALDGALLQSLAADQAAASDAERQKIVQDLHDTLAQNISYLRLKLDQLTGENAIHEISVVLQELERMRATADEAYQQVRNTIDELAIPNGEDLKTTIEHQARVISSRAGFDLHIRQIGDARALPTVTRQHILNISREALHNVEKHAHATQAGLQFIWLEAELILKITDNGVGFHPQPDHDEGHYGLWIMQQRARDIGGMVKISPADGQGTEVTLWVPYLKSAH